MARWAQINLCDEVNLLIHELHYFHELALFTMAILGGIVILIILEVIFNPSYLPKVQAAHTVEGAWILLPGIVLCVIAGPSINALFFIDDIKDPIITIKVTGRQWYWSYEYRDFGDLNFDSYIIPEEDLIYGMYRLLEVDHRTVVPIKVDIRFLITARDVLHSWTVPVLGLKVDAVPGRINQLLFNFMRPGVFYGQCSEICGANHSFIPIVVEVTDLNTFMKWVELNTE